MQKVSTKIDFEHEKIHQQFKYCGRKAIQFRQQCIGMLPQIFKEKIYEKKGFKSIFEYAAKFAGLSEKQVKRGLSIHERVEDKPALRELLEKGEVSINKLAKIVSIVTTENQEVLADQVKLLSCRALETLVRDEKFAQQNISGTNPGTARGNSTGENISECHENQNGLQKALFDHNFVHVNKSELENETEFAQLPELLNLKLTTSNFQKLLELQEKGIDINRLISEMLENREDEIAKEKETIAQQINQKLLIGIAIAGNHERQNDSQYHATKSTNTPSRYIPIKIKRLIRKEQGTKCSMPNCQKPAEQIHHTQRFALAGTHDPRYIAQLCRDHHQIAHTIDLKYHEMRSARVA